MNKIYNNLTVENLTKTEWFNQFDKDQQEEILEGLQANLDVSIYANKEFTSLQMFEIRLGLVDNLDVSLYAKIDLSWSKMNDIRLELLEKKHTFLV